MIVDAEDQPLFPGYEPPAPVDEPEVSPGRRLTLRIAAQVAAGVHPLMQGPLHPDASRETTAAQPVGLCCGSCSRRSSNGWGYPKCSAGPQSHGPATDVRAWWPACPSHTTPETDTP